MLYVNLIYVYFFFNDTATTEIYTLSLHDALPILSLHGDAGHPKSFHDFFRLHGSIDDHLAGDRKSTRLNSSHPSISYAVFCLKKKKKRYTIQLNLSYNTSIIP